MSDAERWERIQEIFHAALDRPESERARFLTDACAGDADLEREVTAMLEADARESLLERGLADTAGRVLGASALPLRIGPWRVVRLLGEGGMGVVYLCEREDLGSTAALKILRDAWLSPARRDRFLAERRTLARLDHPCIARIQDADALPDGTPWFVMEYVDGVPITEYCNTHRLGVRERLRLFRDVCDAVRHAHAHATIHRDIKASNVFVRADGAVKLLDFGIAKHLESVTEDTRTRTGQRFLTPACAAPEQLRGGPIGTWTDVYALGALLYELLAAEPPYDLRELSAADAERTILETDPRPPSTGAERAGGAAQREWEDLDVLCLTALRKEPERRYVTADALIRDIDHFLGGEPLDARADSAAYRLGKFARRNRGRLIGASAALLLALATAAVYAVRLASARDTALAEATRAQRVQAFMLDMLRGEDADAGPPDSLRVVELLDRGAREARTLDAEPAVQAELFGTLGELYMQLGRLDAADSMLTAALALRRTLAGRDSAANGDVADRIVALGLLRAEQARFDEAETLVRAGLDMTRGTRPPGHPGVAQGTAALGRVLELRGAYDDAVPVLEEAVRMHEAAGISAALADALAELGAVHFYAGRLAVSDSVVRRVLTLNREIHGERHPRVADDLITLGAIRFELGRYPEAEQHYRDALAIHEAWYGADHPAVASNLTMLGRALVYLERHDEAVAALERSLDIQRRAFGDAHPRVASALNELGNVASARGRYDEAERHFSRMLEIYRTVYGDGHYLLGIAVSNLGSVHNARGDYVAAERAFRDAVQRFTAALSPGHTQTGIARLKLGRALLRQRRFREAIEESLAGYEILSTQTEPATSFLRAGRQDLAAAYDSLGQHELAARFRADTLSH